MAARPNFLFLVTDQHRYDHLGCYGNRVVQTPNIDTLADSGWLSDAFHVASPVCMPNRATWMTGRMPSVHGVRHNGIPLTLRAATFVEQLRKSGYRTSLVGKCHLQNMMGHPPLWPPAGAKRYVTEAVSETAGRYDQERFTSWHDDPKHDVSLPFYGFEQVQLTVEHGDEVEGHYRRWARKQEREFDRLVGQSNAISTPEYFLAAIQQAWRTRVPVELSTTTYCAQKTIESLEDHQSDSRPFFIQCSFPDPHHPFTPPGQYWGMYAPGDIELPPSYAAAGKSPPPHVAWLHRQRDAGQAIKHTPAPFACSEREAREAVALNYALVTAIDAAIGRILRAVESLGLMQNTVIIFTSDHGDYMGDHQLLLKGPIHYKGLIRTPFIWRDPQGPRGVRDATLAGACDLAPTILERAQAEAYNGIQGQSLWPTISGAQSLARDSLLVEDEGQRIYLGFPSRTRVRTLVSARHRLSVYDGVDWGELYDLREDPDELVNLWSDPRARSLRADMTLQLARKMLHFAETSPYPSAQA